MKSIFKNILAAGAVLMALSSTANAGNSHEIPADKSSPELNRIKTLEGRWTTTTSMFGTKNQRLYVEYDVVANGSAVLERVFPGQPEEMISVYYDDDGKLAMTHYCILRNRPQMKLVKSTDDALVMKVVKVDGKKSKKDPAMKGAITIRFKDKNHIEQSCEGDDGKPVTLNYTRVK